MQQSLRALSAFLKTCSTRTASKLSVRKIRGLRTLLVHIVRSTLYGNVLSLYPIFTPRWCTRISLWMAYPLSIASDLSWSFPQKWSASSTSSSTFSSKKSTRKVTQKKSHVVLSWNATYDPHLHLTLSYFCQSAISWVS